MRNLDITTSGYKTRRRNKTDTLYTLFRRAVKREICGVTARKKRKMGG